MKPRFTIRRKSVEYPNPSPWAVKDAERPAFVGQYARLDLAVKAIDAKLREERGLAPALDLDRDEILAEMRRRRDPSLPATTVAGDPRLSSRDHHEHGAQNGRATRVTVAEAAALQSYPPGFTFAGTKTKQFLQVGNAVPPLLAEAILRAVIS